MTINPLGNAIMYTFEEVLAANGGRPIIRGGETAYNFGLTPSDLAHTAQIAKSFNDVDPIILTQDRIILSKYAKLINGGKYPAYSWQITGSCVNSGAQNTLITLEGIIRATKAEPGIFKRPWTLTSYGGSRKLAFNDDTQGEGSSGDAMALALSLIGLCEFDRPGLPSATDTPIAFHYTQQQELYYSAAHNTPQAILDECKPHKLKYTKITSVEQAEAEIRRLRPFTIAGNWGSRMTMLYKGSGENRVLFGDYASNWEHQMSCHGLWHHPEFGRLWLIMQNWYMIQGGTAVPVHGQPATDEPPGSFWVDDSMIQHQLDYRFGELRSYGDLSGLDQGNIDHMSI